MTTTTVKTSWLRKLFPKAANKNPDWARIEEPDRFTVNVFVAIMTLVLLGFIGAFMLRTSLSLEAFVNGIANFLYSINPSAPFEQLYAGFGFAVLVMLYVLILISYILFGHADEDDVVEMISDLDANIQESISEFEETVNSNLEQIRNDMTVAPADASDEHPQ